MREGQAREGATGGLCTAVTGPGARAVEDREDRQAVPETTVLKDGRRDGGKRETGRKRLSWNPERLDSRGFVVAARALHTS